VFVRLGRVLHLHVGDRVIRTTGEHPFYVWGRGWLPCVEMQPGDLLSSHDGRWVAVEEVYDTGEWETVYNLRVAEHHTYFVGSQEWGFSVWAHNQYLNKQDKTDIAHEWIASKNAAAAEPASYTNASYAQKMKIRAIAHKLIEADPTL
jgi:hypothetical protein